jgi:hypothetical protein
MPEMRKYILLLPLGGDERQAGRKTACNAATFGCRFQALVNAEDTRSSCWTASKSTAFFLGARRSKPRYKAWLIQVEVRDINATGFNL